MLNNLGPRRQPRTSQGLDPRDNKGELSSLKRLNLKKVRVTKRLHAAAPREQLHTSTKKLWLKYYNIITL